MATSSWYVAATNNSAGVFNKVWVTTNPGAYNVIAGPYASEEAAKAAAAQTLGSQAITGWQGTLAILAGAATGALTGNPTSAANAASSAGNSTTGLAAIGDFFQRLTQGNTWVRVGEVVLGLILVAVGVARLTHAVPAATAVAKTVGAAAV